MAFPPIPLILMIVQLVGFGFAIILMLKVYIRHRFLSHLLLAIAFSGMLFSSSIRFAININDDDASLARLSWQTQNFFLVSATILVFWAFIYFQHHSFPFYTNLVSLWGGATILIYMWPELIEMEYDDVFGWNATYDPIVSLFAGVLIVFFIFAFIRPIIIKMRHSNDPYVRRTGYLLILSFLMTLAWGLLSGFTVFPTIRTFRTFLLPLAWLLWAIVTWKNPLSLIFTDARMEKILIATEAGLPILYYDLRNHCTEDATLASGVLTAVTSVLTEILSPHQAKSTIASIKYQEQCVAVRSIEEGYVFYGFSKEEDPGLSSAFSVFIQQFAEAFGHLLRSGGVIEPDMFAPAMNLAESVFGTIYLLDTAAPV
ncbi:MAG: hypothetical protein ACFFGZ_04885 [Candidatus Thorarchaeota archaeon]